MNSNLQTETKPGIPGTGTDRSYHGKTAWVTGASSGLGEALA